MEDAGEKAKNAEGDVDEQGAAAPVHDEDGEGGEEEGGDQGDQVPSFIPAAALTFAGARAHLFSFLRCSFNLDVSLVTVSCLLSCLQHLIR